MKGPGVREEERTSEVKTVQVLSQRPHLRKCPQVSPSTHNIFHLPHIFTHTYTALYACAWRRQTLQVALDYTT